MTLNSEEVVELETSLLVALRGASPSLLQGNAAECTADHMNCSKKYQTKTQNIIVQIMNAEKLCFYFDFSNRETKMTKSKELLGLQYHIFHIYI